MHPLLEALHRDPEFRLDRESEHRIRSLLRLGPWLWPRSADRSSCYHEAVKRIAGSKPDVPRGSTLLLGYNPDTGASSLWALVDTPDPALDPCGFDVKARAAWRSVTAALPRSLPFVWHSVEAAATSDLHAVHLSRSNELTGGRPDEELSGSSFGLAFALALASRVLGAHSRGDVAATGAVDETGAVAPVDGLAQKVREVCAHAPGVSVLLVPADEDCVREAQEGARLTGNRVMVKPVGTVAEALDVAFPSLGRLLAPDALPEADRTEVVESLFALALGERAASVDWSPIKRAAEAALGWSHRAQGEYTCLGFAAAIAGRHEHNEGLLPVEVDWAAWLRGLPEPRRTNAAAHIVQQAADAGNPSPADARALAEHFLHRGPDAFEPHLRLLGALGRLEAAAGHPKRALEHQREAVDAWFERREWTQSTYALCAWYRTAGALGDGESFDEARNREKFVRARAELPPLSAAYLTLARDAGAILLKRSVDVTDDLRTLSGNRRLPTDLYLGAVRWLIEAATLASDLKGVAHARNCIETAPTWTETLRRHRARILALVALDDALRKECPAEAEFALVALDKEEPNPLRVLVANRPLEYPDVATYVRRFYPY